MSDGSSFKIEYLPPPNRKRAAQIFLQNSTNKVLTFPGKYVRVSLTVKEAIPYQRFTEGVILHQCRFHKTFANRVLRI